MNTSDKVDSKQVLAVSLALIMLVSAGAMAFVGGAAAQTGGTFDTAIDDREDVGNEVSIDDDAAVQLVGPNSSYTGVDVNDDGSINVSAAPSETDEFGGVAVSADRVDSLFDPSASPDDRPADFLDEVVSNYSVNGDGDVGFAGKNETYPAIFIEYDPQSDFSQISGPDGDVDGEHDYLVVVADGSNDVTAYSVDNDNVNDTTTPVSGASTFGDVFDTLVGSNDADLQNKNIDEITFAAGVGLDEDTDFQSGGFNGANVSDVRISDGNTERLINSEKIALNPGGNTKFYSSIGTHPNGAPSALDDASSGDTIDVAAGNYSTFEDQNNITVDSGVTITGAESGNVEDRVQPDQTLTNASDETQLEVNISVTADDVTLDSLVVDPSDAEPDIVDIDGAASTVNNSIVLQPDTDTGISVSSTADRTAAIDNVAIIANDPDTVSDGDTGLNLDTGSDVTEDITGTYILGHQTQVDGNSDFDETTILDQFEGSTSQSAVAINASSDTVVGNAIHGSINDADADARDSTDNLEVSNGTYDHVGPVEIQTTDVTVTDLDAATITNGELEINASGDITVEGFSIDSNDLNASSGAPDSLTVNDTEAQNFDVQDIDTVSLDGTSASGDYFLGNGTALGSVTLTQTDATDDYDVDATGNVNVTGATGSSSDYDLDTSGDVNVDDSDGATIDIGSTTTPGTVSVDSGTATNYAINATGDVTVDGVDVDASSTDGIDITSSPENVTVRDSDVTLASSDHGVDLVASGETGETITVTNVTVDGDGNDATGVELTEMGTTDASNSYTIENSLLENLANGTGVNVSESGVPDDNSGTFIMDDNEIVGGAEFIGVDYDLPDTSGVAFTNNEIVGADVANGGSSVGILFDEVDDFGSAGIIEPADDDVMTFEENVITGHARLIEDSSSSSATVSEADYTAIYNSSNDLNNEMGTLVAGAEGTTYSETFADTSTIYGNLGVTYLPGSINESLNLVGESGIDEADLVVRDPDVTKTTDVSSLPDTYDDDSATFPNVDSVDLDGQNDDGSVTAETTFTVTDAGNATENHNITDLTIESNGDAITVNKNNTQSTFQKLDVNATGSGLIVDADSEDVNVIEVSDSQFEVDNDGIVLSGGTDGANAADDRDGFVVHNVDINGSGIGDGYTGLDLSEVEKPGKDSLDVSLTITDNNVNDFGTQVDVGDDLNSSINATAFLDESSPGVTGVTIDNNDFSHVVLVKQNESTLSDDDLYGSVNSADAAASDGDIVEIRNTQSDTAPSYYNHDGTADNGNVEVATVNVTVSGPVAAPGSADVRDNEVVIQDPINVTSDNVTVEGIAVVAPEGNDVLADQYGADAGAGNTTLAVVGAESDNNLTVRNASITTTIDSDSSAGNEMPVGIGAAANTSSEQTLEVRDTFVGDHDADAGTTTGSAVVAQQNVTLTIAGSTLQDGANGVDTSGTSDTLLSEAYGVIAGQGTSPTITETDVSGFDADGVNTIAEDVTVTGGEVVSNNAGDLDTGVGGVVTNSSISAPATQYDIDETNVSANDGPGIELTDVGIALDDAEVSDNNATGVDVTGANTASVNDTTVSDNGDIAVTLDAGDVTVQDNDVSGSTDGVVVDNTSATVSVSGNDVSVTSDGTGVDLNVDDADVDQNTIENGDTGLDLDVAAASNVTRNTISDNTDGLVVETNADLVTVTGNSFSSGEIDIENNDDATLDATLNYFGTSLGPDDGAGVSDSVTYDPFLTEDRTSATVSEIQSTTDFGHDVVIPEDGLVSIGFPAEPEADTVGGVVNGDVAGTVYKWNQSEQSFESADTSDSIDAFDVLVVENRDNKPTTALIDYADDRSRNDPIKNTFEFKEGFNFVPAQQVGTVDEALFAGSGSDYVAQPFSAGENLYGDTDASQVRDEFTSPSEDGFGANFRSGVGDRIVHPHVGYFVIVNEESNIGNTRSEQIPASGAPTADTIAERTGANPANYQLSSVSATATPSGNASNANTTNVVVDVANLGDVDGDEQTVNATALTGLNASATQNVTLNADEEQTLEFTLEESGKALNEGDQVRVEVRIEGTDESVKVTATA